METSSLVCQFRNHHTLSDFVPDQKKNLQIIECLTFSHLSTHLVWNSWLHGRTRSSSRSLKSHMHTTHDVWSILDFRASELNRYEGSCSISAFIRPLGLASPNLSARFSNACNKNPKPNLIKYPQKFLYTGISIDRINLQCTPPTFSILDL